MIGTKGEVSSIEVVVPMFARPDTGKCVALSNGVGACMIHYRTRCESDGALFAVLNLREHRADGYRRSIRRYQFWHVGVEVSEHAIRRDFLIDEFERRFAL